MADVIFVGLSTIDVLYSVDEFPKANEKVAARSQEVFVGGPATNACIAYAHLGGKAALVTAGWQSIPWRRWRARKRCDTGFN